MKILILLAGGIGKRTGLNYPKQFHEVNGKSLLKHLIERIENHVDKIVLVLDKQFRDEYKGEKIVFADNGSERLFSIQNALLAANMADGDVVHIHDAARTLLSSRELSKNELELKKGCPVISSADSFDTMFVIDEKREIKKIYAKSQIVRGMTPQTYFATDLIEQLDKIISTKSEKDLTEILDLRFRAIDQVDNLRKVTTSEDINWIEGEI